MDEARSGEETQVGKCKWFNVSKGYGFIKPDTGQQDVFVHQSEILMEGFRSLETGERVRFSIRKRKDGFEAFNVRSEDEETSLKGSSIHPLGKNKGNVIRCFGCGRYGNHVAAKCKALTDSEKKICYQCRSNDHLLTNCPQSRRGLFETSETCDKKYLSSDGEDASLSDVKLRCISSNEVV